MFLIFAKNVDFQAPQFVLFIAKYQTVFHKNLVSIKFTDYTQQTIP